MAIPLPPEVTNAFAERLKAVNAAQVARQEADAAVDRAEAALGKTIKGYATAICRSWPTNAVEQLTSELMDRLGWVRE